MFKTMYKRQFRQKLVQFVVYCVLFVMMSTNIEKIQLF